MRCPERVDLGDLADLSGLSILVVDDDADSREFLRMGLETCGARVVEASNTATARQFVQTQPLNLVVTDLAMPREDGVSLLRWLRARRPDHNGTPAVVAVTAFYERYPPTGVPGYAAYFQKPIKIEDFVATVASVLGRGTGGGVKRV